MCTVCDEFGRRGNCPCCSKEPETVRCPECNGTGLTYYDEDGQMITLPEYALLSESERYAEECEECGGRGEVEYENEDD